MCFVACAPLTLLASCFLPLPVHPDLELVPNAGSDRSWTWRTIDYSMEEGEKMTFALRFKDAETANAYKAKYDECRAINAANDKPTEA